MIGKNKSKGRILPKNGEFSKEIFFVIWIGGAARIGNLVSVHPIRDGAGRFCI